MSSKRKNGRNAVEEALAGATERVLKQITEVRDVLSSLWRMFSYDCPSRF